MKLDKFKFNRPRQEKEILNPVVDIRETEKEVILEVDLPGADKDSLNVELQGDQLKITASKKKEPIDGKYTVLYQERAVHAEYERAFQLNAEIDRQKINAGFNNGVLRIALAKAEVAQPQKITISS